MDSKTIMDIVSKIAVLETKVSILMWLNAGTITFFGAAFGKVALKKLFNGNGKKK
jgi:hypothetical protein